MWDWLFKSKKNNSNANLNSAIKNYVASIRRLRNSNPAQTRNNLMVASAGDRTRVVNALQNYVTKVNNANKKINNPNTSQAAALNAAAGANTAAARVNNTWGNNNNRALRNAHARAQAINNQNLANARARANALRR